MGVLSSAAIELEFFSVGAGDRSRVERVERHAPSRGGNGIGDGRGLKLRQARAPHELRDDRVLTAAAANEWHFHFERDKLEI